MDPKSLRVLMVSSDRKVLEPGSAVSTRIQDYGALVGELQVVLLSDNAHGLVETGLAPNVRVFPTNSVNRFFRPIDAVKIGQKLSCSLITTQDPFECGWAGVKLKQKLKVPLEVQLHTDPFSPNFAGLLNLIRKRIAKKVIKNADSLRVVGESLAGKISKYFAISSEKITVLPIYVDRSRLDSGSPPFDLHERFGWQFIMLAVARLTPEKNLSLALELLQKIRFLFPNTGLVIVGAGPEEGNLKSRAARLGLDKNVVFVGWQEDLVWYYRTANLFIQTSNFEGYGLALVEAGLAGLPVLTTAVGIANDLLNGKEAFVCPVGDTECLFRGAHALIENNAKRETMRISLRDKLDAVLVGKEEYLKQLIGAWVRVSSVSKI